MRSLFDLWFISQKMGIQYRPPDTRIEPRELKRELAKYLPSSYQRVIEELL